MKSRHFLLLGAVQTTEITFTEIDQRFPKKLSQGADFLWFLKSKNHKGRSGAIDIDFDSAGERPTEDYSL